jgi:ComF family protein
MAATPYADLAKEVIHRLKFERAQAVAADVAAVLASGIVLDDITCITYVPTAPGRIRSRGYDQAALMAKAISRRTGLPCYALLARKGSQRQVGQGRIARHQQMQDAFYARNAGMARGKHILLIDDVLTTGATCEAAARVLLQSGARRVSAAVFAAA